VSDDNKTVPNISLPDDDSAPDWGKTNYNHPKQPAADDWGKTVTNIKPIDTEQDFGKTFIPGAQQRSSTPEWGMTEANIDLADANFGSRGGNDYDEGFGKTTPYFRLPEAERAKYQDLPPTPTEQAEQEKKEAKEKGGIPSWFWVSAGLMSMFFFAIVVFVIVYFIILRDRGFEVTVMGAPPGSIVQVDGSPIAVTSDDGTFRLKNLKAGMREIRVIHPAYTCENRTVTGKDGDNPEPVSPHCTPIKAKPTDDCTNIKPGEENKAETCFNAALAALPDPFTVDDLIKALNLLVINFESGKFDIPDVRKAALQKSAEYIKKFQDREPNVVLEVGGHTDSVGNDTNNQTLSENRADAVKRALVKFGVKDSGLVTKGYGKAKPIADNNTEEGKFHNRRIEYSVAKK
jgi:outer membrane protein OmpA-like peptidoglycan-associated protein